MQISTVAGLNQASECITLTLNKLENLAAFMNYAYRYIIDYLKIKLNEEGEEGQRCILKYPPKFIALYNTYRHAIEVDIGNKANSMMIDTKDIDIALAEIKAFYIPYIAKNLIISLLIK